jgi:hypothetical protein
MSNTPIPSRIEREAEAWAHLSVITGTMKEEAVREAYKSGAYYQVNRAAPVVKALEAALAYHDLSPDLYALFTTALSQYNQST